MLKTLNNLGFKLYDAEVYVFLAFNGPKKAQDIASSLKMKKSQVYRSLKNLRNKEIIQTNLPAQFSAISLDKVLESFVQAKLKEAKRMENNKEDVLALWKSSLKENSQTRS
jgi:sugar-specific transcriptional regulator TrmB